MPKRRMHDSDERFDYEDDPIGLTSAFAPVKGPQSVDYDVNDDPVGLTGAFGAITENEDTRAWDDEGKWKDFDWDTALGEPSAAPAEEGDSPDQVTDSEDSGTSSIQDQPPKEDEGEREGDDAKADQGSGEGGAKTPKHGRHAAPQPQVSQRMRKSQRTRRVLIVLVILLVVVLIALGYFVFRTFSNSQQEAAQQAQEQVAAPRDDIDSPKADDATESTTKLADVPDLSVLLGKNQDEAVKLLDRGALITANRPVEEEGNPIKANLNVALTEEPADSKTGTPTVYLGVSAEGIVLQAGYSASATALGFGSLSFADAVSNEHVIEKTLAKVGVKVPEGSAVLPSDRDEYSTYASDGTTVVRERCSFEGDAEVAGVPCTWSSVLSYDYTTQVVTGNLSDTVRIIYVYITQQ